MSWCRLETKGTQLLFSRGGGGLGFGCYVYQGFKV